MEKLPKEEQKVTYLFVAERPLEKSEERCQAKSVHVVNLTQVTDDKVQTGTILSQWQVCTSFL